MSRTRLTVVVKQRCAINSSGAENRSFALCKTPNRALLHFRTLQRVRGVTVRVISGQPPPAPQGIWG